MPKPTSAWETEADAPAFGSIFTPWMDVSSIAEPMRSSMWLVALGPGDGDRSVATMETDTAAATSRSASAPEIARCRFL